MGLKRHLENQPHFTIDLYNKREHIQDECVPFEGSPRKHPYDHDKLILVTDPFSQHATIYEFRMKDIEAVEDIASVGTTNGENISMVRLWIRKNSFGLRMEPFQVETSESSKREGGKVHPNNNKVRLA